MLTDNEILRLFQATHKRFRTVDIITKNELAFARAIERATLEQAAEELLRRQSENLAVEMTMSLTDVAAWLRSRADEVPR